MTEMTNPLRSPRFLGHYRLVDGEPVICKDLQEWLTWSSGAAVEDDVRRVGKTTLDNGTFISTVFLCLDHNYGDGPPVLWETMVFNVPDTWRVKLRRLWCKITRVRYVDCEDDIQERCSGNWDAAKTMHANMVAKMIGLKPPKEGTRWVVTDTRR